jgi:hypothetical protein
MNSGLEKLITLRRIGDFAIYTFVGLLFFGGVMIAAFHSTLEIPEDASKWIGLAVNTVVLFGYIVSTHSRHARRPVFWGALLVLLVCHIGLFWMLFLIVPFWRPLWSVATVPLEYIAIDLTLSTLGYPSFGRR